MCYEYNPKAADESSGRTSPTLLSGVRSREPQAWQRFVRIYGPVLFLWCRKAGLSRHDAADIVQNTFAAVAGHIAEFRRRRPDDSFRGWLWTITQNKIRDHFRQLKGTAQARGGTTAQLMLAEVPESDMDSSTSSEDEVGLIQQGVVEAIRAEFEDRTWKAFWQLAIEGRTAAEIAIELGMTKRAVRQAKYRVLCRLREEMADLL